MDVNTALLAAFGISAALNVFMMFRVYHAIPREVLESVLDYAGRRAGETPTPTDDEAVSLLRKVVEWINQQTPTTQG